MGDLVIWWLSQEDCEQMEWMMYPYGGPFPSPDEYQSLLEQRQANPILPKYIESEWYSRDGRSGRGELWVPGDIDLEEIPFVGPMAEAASDCGGIVIRAEDSLTVAFLPGFVTDLDLKPYVFDWTQGETIMNDLTDKLEPTFKPDTSATFDGKGLHRDQAPLEPDYSANAIQTRLESILWRELRKGNATPQAMLRELGTRSLVAMRAVIVGENPDLAGDNFALRAAMQAVRAQLEAAVSGSGQRQTQPVKVRIASVEPGPYRGRGGHGIEEAAGEEPATVPQPNWAANAERRAYLASKLKGAYSSLRSESTQATYRELTEGDPEALARVVAGLAEALRGIGEEI